MLTQNDKAAFAVGLRFGEGGRYEIRERIGSGGMADVYKVVDTQLHNRLYAVKVLSSSIGPHAETIRAFFIDEAQALSRIRDNNVVAVITNGQLPDDNHTPYMVMEYLEGQDLSVTLKKEKHLSVERSADIIVAVCAGINACHLAGVIHRDLKPANIFLDRTLKGEEPKVLDFSVAKISISREQSQTDFRVGTECYMAPEQANGKPADERSDQYSIGALLYLCLTGRVPRGFLSQPRELRPDIPEELETVMLRAMDPTPERRFMTVHELGRNLLPFGSAISRAKWEHYYTTPPVALRSVYSAPLANSTAPPTSVVPGTSVSEYDFLVHDRTTRLVDDANESPGPRAVASTAATTALFGVPREPPSSNVKPYPRRGRVIAGSAFLVVLVAIGLTVALRRARKADESPPLAPAWTQSLHPEPSPPAAVAPPAPQSRPLVAVPLPPAEVVSEPRELKAPELPGGLDDSKSVARKKRRRDAHIQVQYTPDGIPIMH